MKIINFRFPKQPKSKQFIKNSLSNYHIQSQQFCSTVLSAITTRKQDPVDAVANILNQHNIHHLVTILQYYSRRKATINKDGFNKMEGQCEDRENGDDSKYMSKIREKNLEIRTLHEKIGQLKAELERKNQKINTLIREYQNWYIQKQRHELLGNISNYDKYWKSFNNNLISCQPVKMGSSEQCANKGVMRKEYRTKKMNKYRSHQSIQEIQNINSLRNTNNKIQSIGNSDKLGDMNENTNAATNKKSSRNALIEIKQSNNVLKQCNINALEFETDKLITSEDLICDPKFNEANSRSQMDGIKTESDHSQKQINERNSVCHNMDISDCSDFPQEMFI